MEPLRPWHCRYGRDQGCLGRHAGCIATASPFGFFWGGVRHQPFPEGPSQVPCGSQVGCPGSLCPLHHGTHVHTHTHAVPPPFTAPLPLKHPVNVHTDTAATARRTCVSPFSCALTAAGRHQDPTAAGQDGSVHGNDRLRAQDCGSGGRLVPLQVRAHRGIRAGWSLLLLLPGPSLGFVVGSTFQKPGKVAVAVLRISHSHPHVWLWSL